MATANRPIRRHLELLAKRREKWDDHDWWILLVGLLNEVEPFLPHLGLTPVGDRKRRRNLSSMPIAVKQTRAYQLLEYRELEVLLTQAGEYMWCGYRELLSQTWTVSTSGLALKEFLIQATSPDADTPPPGISFEKAVRTMAERLEIMVREVVEKRVMSLLSLQGLQGEVGWAMGLHPRQKQIHEH